MVLLKPVRKTSCKGAIMVGRVVQSTAMKSCSVGENIGLRSDNSVGKWEFTANAQEQ